MLPNAEQEKGAPNPLDANGKLVTKPPGVKKAYFMLRNTSSEK